MSNLGQMNLTKNCIEKVEGLQACTKLEVLLIGENRLGQNDDLSEIECCRGLLDCPAISTLDISKNHLSDPAILPEIFEKMPNLTVLYCKGNDFVRKISNYRKTMIFKIPTLEYLDERPVTSEERRRAIAFGVGQ